MEINWRQNSQHSAVATSPRVHRQNSILSFLFQIIDRLFDSTFLTELLFSRGIVRARVGLSYDSLRLSPLFR